MRLTNDRLGLTIPYLTCLLGTCDCGNSSAVLTDPAALEEEEEDMMVIGDLQVVGGLLREVVWTLQFKTASIVSSTSWWWIKWP